MFFLDLGGRPVPSAGLDARSTVRAAGGESPSLEVEPREPAPDFRIPRQTGLGPWSSRSRGSVLRGELDGSSFDRPTFAARERVVEGDVVDEQLHLAAMVLNASRLSSSAVPHRYRDSWAFLLFHCPANVA